MNLEDLKQKVAEFRDERDWRQFHNPKDLAIAISVEANELLELFQWKLPDEVEQLLKEKQIEIGEELADILIFMLSFSDVTGIDLLEEVDKKIVKNNQKYPKELVKGSAKKYTEVLK